MTSAVLAGQRPSEVALCESGGSHRSVGGPRRAALGQAGPLTVSRRPLASSGRRHRPPGRGHSVSALSRALRILGGYRLGPRRRLLGGTLRCSTAAALCILRSHRSLPFCTAVPKSALWGLSLTRLLLPSIPIPGRWDYLVCPAFIAVGCVDCRARRPKGGHRAEEVPDGVPAHGPGPVEASGPIAEIAD